MSQLNQSLLETQVDGVVLFNFCYFYLSSYCIKHTAVSTFS